MLVTAEDNKHRSNKENGTSLKGVDKEHFYHYYHSDKSYIRPKQFDYWNPSLIMLSCNKEQCECDIFGNNYYRYVPAQYSFEIRLNNTDVFFSYSNSDKPINLSPLTQLFENVFTDCSIIGCINRLVTEANDVDRYYQYLKNKILKEIERILFERDSILRKNHYEDNVISSNLYNNFLLKEEYLSVIERIEEYMKALFKEIDALNKEIKEGKLIGYDRM